MTYQFEKIINEAENQSGGLLLTKAKYVIYYNNEEIGYYFINPNADYFFYWDDNSIIQSGVVDKWEKTMRLNEKVFVMGAESICCDYIVLKTTSFERTEFLQSNTVSSFLFTNNEHQLFIKWQQQTTKKEVNQKILLQGEIETDINEIDWLFAVIAFKEININ